MKLVFRFILLFFVSLQLVQAQECLVIPDRDSSTFVRYEEYLNMINPDLKNGTHDKGVIFYEFEAGSQGTLYKMKVENDSVYTLERYVMGSVDEKPQFRLDQKLMGKVFGFNTENKELLPGCYYTLCEIAEGLGVLKIIIIQYQERLFMISGDAVTIYNTLNNHKQFFGLAVYLNTVFCRILDSKRRDIKLK